MTRTVQELIDELSDMPPDAEVRVANQPAWPLQFTVAGVASSDDLPADVAEEHAEQDVVWIVTGDHPRDDSPYAPGEVWEVAR